MVAFYLATTVTAIFGAFSALFFEWRQCLLISLILTVLSGIAWLCRSYVIVLSSIFGVAMLFLLLAVFSRSGVTNPQYWWSPVTWIGTLLFSHIALVVVTSKVLTLDLVRHKQEKGPKEPWGPDTRRA